MALGLLIVPSGCVNFGAMMGKMLFGDPQVTSHFQDKTGVALEEGEHRVAFVCTAPASTNDRFDTLQLELQEEVSRRLRRRNLDVVRTDDVLNAMDSVGGKFDRKAIADELGDVDYILHLDIEQFSVTEPASPDLYRGRASGMIYAYEVDNSGTGDGMVVQIFFRQLESEFPKSHPVTSDQMSARVFQRQFIDQLADTVGQTFYSVRTSELFQ
ncbi:MAG: hypothetical protein DWQ29_09000 [Planctomycetota bacterium]|nr:MAG: hypothetical protein DWQ29_09000 [Planctomycetota bacterium]